MLDWEKEVELYDGGKGVHKVVFHWPDREGVSVRKRDNANRTYGTKKRPSKSKKVLKVATVTESDDDVRVPVHELSKSFSEEYVNEVIGVAVNKSKNSVVNKSTSVVDDDIIVVNDVVPDKSSDKELSSS